MSLKYEEAYRQGDVLIFKVKDKDMPFHFYGHNLRAVPSGVIRVGEKEGHEHKLEGGDAKLSMDENKEQGVIEVNEETTLTHPEHGNIKLKKGKYVTMTQQEAKGKNATASVKD